MSHKPDTVASNRSSASTIGVQDPQYVRFTYDQKRTWVHVLKETLSSLSVYVSSCIQKIVDLVIDRSEAPLFASDRGFDDGLDEDADSSAVTIDFVKYHIQSVPVIYSLRQLEKTSLANLIRLQQQTSLVHADIRVLEVAIERINSSQTNTSDLKDSMFLVSLKDSLKEYLEHLELVIKEKIKIDEEYSKYQEAHETVRALRFHGIKKEFGKIDFTEEKVEKLVASLNDSETENQILLAPFLIHINALQRMVKYWNENGGHEGLTDLSENHVALIKGIVAAYRERTPLVMQKMFQDEPFLFLTDKEQAAFHGALVRKIAAPAIEVEYEMSLPQQRIFELLVLQLPMLSKKTDLTEMQVKILNQVKIYLAQQIGNVANQKATYVHYRAFCNAVIGLIPNFANGIDELKRPENGYFFITLYLEMLSDENRPTLEDLTYIYLQQGKEVYSSSLGKEIVIRTKEYESSVTRHTNISFNGNFVPFEIEDANAQAIRFVGEGNEEWLEPLKSVVGPQGSPQIKLFTSDLAYAAMYGVDSDWNISFSPNNGPNETGTFFTKKLGADGKILSLEVTSKVTLTLQAKHKDRGTLVEVLPLQMEFTLEYSIIKDENGNWIRANILEKADFYTIDPVIEAENQIRTLDISVTQREFFEYLHSGIAEGPHEQALKDNKEILFSFRSDNDSFAYVNTLVENWIQNPEAFESFDPAKRELILAAYFYGQQDEEKLKNALQNPRFLSFLRTLLPYSNLNEQYERITSVLVSLGLNLEDENRFATRVRAFANKMPADMIYLTGGSLYAHMLNPSKLTADDQTQKFVEVLKTNRFFVRTIVESWKAQPELMKEWKPREIEFLVAAYLALELGVESREIAPYAKIIRAESAYYVRLQSRVNMETFVHTVRNPYEVVTDKLLKAVDFLEMGDLEGFRSEMKKEAEDIHLLEVKYGIDILAFFEEFIKHCEGDGTDLAKKHEIAAQLVKLTPILANVILHNIQEFYFTSDKAKKICAKIYVIASGIQQEEKLAASTDPNDRAKHKRVEKEFVKRIQESSSHYRGGALLAYMESPNRFLVNGRMDDLLETVTRGIYFVKHTVDGWNVNPASMKVWNEREIEILVAAYIAFDLGEIHDCIQSNVERIRAEADYYRSLRVKTNQAFDLHAAIDPYTIASYTLNRAIAYLENGNQDTFYQILQENEAEMNLLKAKYGVDIEEFFRNLIDHCTAEMVGVHSRKEIALQMAKLPSTLLNNLDSIFKTEQAKNRFRWVFEITEDVRQTQSLAEDVVKYLNSGKKDPAEERDLMDRMLAMRPIVFFEEFFWVKNSELALSILSHFDSKVTSEFKDFLVRRKLIQSNLAERGLAHFHEAITSIKSQTMTIEAYDANIELINAAIAKASEKNGELNNEMSGDYYRRGEPVAAATFLYGGSEVPGITSEEFHENLVARAAAEENFSLWDKAIQRIAYSQYVANMSTPSGALKGAYKMTLVDGLDFKVIEIDDYEYMFDLNADHRMHCVDTIDDTHKVITVVMIPSIAIVSLSTSAPKYLVVPEGFARMEQKVYLELQGDKVVATSVEERIILDGKEIVRYNKDAILEREALSQ